MILMPPTLVASVYGMNFKHMPELDWPYGYPMALALMVDLGHPAGPVVQAARLVLKYRRSLNGSAQPFLKRAGAVLWLAQRSRMSSQAQPHHLALDAQALREAVEAHQRYLAGRSGGRRLSLTYADLSNCTLEGARPARGRLRRRQLQRRDAGARQPDPRPSCSAPTCAKPTCAAPTLPSADLRGACLRGANLAGAELPGCDLREGRIALQDKLDGFRILRHEHRPGELNYAILSGANLAGAQMTGAVAMSSDFTDANLSGAHAGRRQADARGAGRRRPDRRGPGRAPTSPAPR